MPIDYICTELSVIHAVYVTVTLCTWGSLHPVDVVIQFVGVHVSRAYNSYIDLCSHTSIIAQLATCGACVAGVCEMSSADRKVGRRSRPNAVQAERKECATVCTRHICSSALTILGRQCESAGCAPVALSEQGIIGVPLR